MDDEDYSLEQFDEYLDGHFGEILPKKSDYRFRDDALVVVNGHETTAAQRAEMQGRKLIVHSGAAGSGETLIRRGRSWQLDGHGHPVGLPLAKPCPISEHAKANPVRSNLRIPTPRLPNLDAEEEAGLIRGAQAGDRGAAKRLLDHFHGWLRYRAWESWKPLQKKNFKMEGIVSTPRKERAETLEDYVAAAAFAFWESVCDWRSGNKQLCTYAWKHVYGALSNISWARKAAGFKDESDLARHIRAHSHEPLAAFKRFFAKYKPFQVYQEIARQGFLVEERDEYSEGSVRDQGSGDGESGGDGCHIEKGGTRISDGLERFNDFNKHLHLHKRVSQRIDDAARDSDLRALRHLKEVGRPAYAQELVEKERKHLAACKARDAAEWKKAEASRQAQAFAELEKHRSHSNWLLPPERKHGHHHDARRIVRRVNGGDGARRRRAGD